MRGLKQSDPLLPRFLWSRDIEDARPLASESAIIQIQLSNMWPPSSLSPLCPCSLVMPKSFQTFPARHQALSRWSGCGLQRLPRFDKSLCMA